MRLALNASESPRETLQNTHMVSNTKVLIY